MFNNSMYGLPRMLQNRWNRCQDLTGKCIFVVHIFIGRGIQQLICLRRWLPFSVGGIYVLKIFVALFFGMPEAYRVFVSCKLFFEIFFLFLIFHVIFFFFLINKVPIYPQFFFFFKMRDLWPQSHQVQTTWNINSAADSFFGNNTL